MKTIIFVLVIVSLILMGCSRTITIKGFGCEYTHNTELEACEQLAQDYMDSFTFSTDGIPKKIWNYPICSQWCNSEDESDLELCAHNCKKLKN